MENQVQKALDFFGMDGSEVKIIIEDDYDIDEELRKATSIEEMKHLVHNPQLLKRLSFEHYNLFLHKIHQQLGLRKSLIDHVLFDTLEEHSVSGQLLNLIYNNRQIADEIHMIRGKYKDLNRGNMTFEDFKESYLITRKNIFTNLSNSIGLVHELQHARDRYFYLMTIAISISPIPISILYNVYDPNILVAGVLMATVLWLINRKIVNEIFFEQRARNAEIDYLNQEV